MTDKPLMKCGCVAMGVLTARNGEKLAEPLPSCPIHNCTELADARPPLEGRFAECAYLPHGHARMPSSYDLAFFQFRGEGSREATEICVCGYARAAHDDDGRLRMNLNSKCPGFAARGAQETDKYYCGCFGWD